MSLRVPKFSFPAVVFVSTYPPRRCGIATFTQDLKEAIEGLAFGPRPLGVSELQVVCMVEDFAERVGDSVVTSVLQDDQGSYLEAANYIDLECPAQVVSVQHEFGIFGGEDGEYIIPFLESLKKPAVTTFHTVLRHPTGHMKAVVKDIVALSRYVVVIAKGGKEVLAEVYGVDPSRVVVIPHGVPAPGKWDRDLLRRSLGLFSNRVLSTIGLINPGKGIEYVVEAVARLCREFPDVVYLVVGQTHPVVKRRYGEAYREHLQEVAQKLGVDGNLRFVNEYLSRSDLLRYLVATDVYVAPYLNEEQISSGTLAYALAMGKAVVSTPFAYAREVLSAGRGLFANFTDSVSLAAAVGAILRAPDLRTDLEKRASDYGTEIQWPAVASKYSEVFRAALRKQGKRVAVLEGPTPGRRRD